MRLNLFEHIMINNHLRAWVLEYLEARQLLRLGGPVAGEQALEVGCGIGSGIDLIYSKFGATSVDAFDLDPKVVCQAYRRHYNHAVPTLLWAGNVRQIPVRDAQYDAVFCFGVLHHVRKWRQALTEIYRVLKPGGRFYCEEILKKYITHPLFRRLLYHPQNDRFDRHEFGHALVDAGFQIEQTAEMFNLFGWFIADKP